ncbi:MAG: hypothetical protein ACPKOI_08465 [Pleomorphochaeta sp.]
MKKTLLIALLLLQSVFLFAQENDSPYEIPELLMDYNSLTFIDNLTDFSTSFRAEMNFTMKLPVIKNVQNKNIQLGCLELNSDMARDDYSSIYSLALLLGAYNIKIDSPESDTSYSGLITGFAIPLSFYSLSEEDGSYRSLFIWGWDHPSVDIILGRMVKTQVENLFGYTEDLSIALMLNNNLSYYKERLMIRSSIGIELGVFF